MRITKKYAGASCLGNKISRLCDRPKFSPQDVEMARMEIARLERRFQLRLSRGMGVPLPPDEATTTAVEPPKLNVVAPGHPMLAGHHLPIMNAAAHQVLQHQQLQRANSADHLNTSVHTTNGASSFTASLATGNNNNNALGVPIVPVVHHGPTPGGGGTAASNTGSPTGVSAASTAAPASSVGAPSSIQSYLATLANNAQLAAASLAGSNQRANSAPAAHNNISAATTLASNVAPILVGVNNAHQPAPAMANNVAHQVQQVAAVAQQPVPASATPSVLQQQQAAAAATAAQAAQAKSNPVQQQQTTASAMNQQTQQQMLLPGLSNLPMLFQNSLATAVSAPPAVNGASAR